MRPALPFTLTPRLNRRPIKSNDPVRPQPRNVGLGIARLLQYLLSMLAEPSRGTLDAATAVGEAEPRSDYRHQTIACLHALQHIAMGKLRVSNDLGDGPDARAGYIGLCESRLPGLVVL